MERRGKWNKVSAYLDWIKSIITTTPITNLRTSTPIAPVKTTTTSTAGGEILTFKNRNNTNVICYVYARNLTHYLALFLSFLEIAGRLLL